MRHFPAVSNLVGRIPATVLLVVGLEVLPVLFAAGVASGETLIGFASADRATPGLDLLLLPSAVSACFLVVVHAVLRLLESRGWGLCRGLSCFAMGCFPG